MQKALSTSYLKLLLLLGCLFVLSCQPSVKRTHVVAFDKLQIHSWFYHTDDAILQRPLERPPLDSLSDTLLREAAECDNPALRAMAIHELIRRNSTDMMTYIRLGLRDTASFSVLRSEWDNERSTVAHKTLHSITYFRKARSTPHFTMQQLYELDSTFLARNNSTSLEDDPDVRAYVRGIDTNPQFYDSVRQRAIAKPGSPYFGCLLRFNRPDDTTVLNTIVCQILGGTIDSTDATEEQTSVLFDLGYNRLPGSDSLLLSLCRSSIALYTQREREYHNAKIHGDFRERLPALRGASSMLRYCLYALSMIPSPASKSLLNNCVRSYNKNPRLHMIADHAWAACSTVRSGYFSDVVLEYNKVGRFKGEDLNITENLTRFAGDPEKRDYLR